MKSSLRSAAPESAWMPMSPVPPSPAMASTVISFSRPVALSPARTPEAAAAVDGNATLIQGTSTEASGNIPPSTVRQLAGTVITMRPSSALVIGSQADTDPAAGTRAVAGQQVLLGGEFDDARHRAITPPQRPARPERGLPRCFAVAIVDVDDTEGRSDRIDRIAPRNPAIEAPMHSEKDDHDRVQR